MAAFDPQWITIAWLVLGVGLIIGELAIPGLVAVFLGGAALMVAGFRYVGLIESLTASMAAWMGLSVALTVGLRNTVRRYLPAEVSRGEINENVAAVGSVVDVIEAVDDETSNGRIRYQGTSWPATSTRGPIAVGAKARLFARDNLVWIVEPALELGSGLEDEQGDK